MELESAVRRHLLSCQALNGYVAGRVFRHRLEEKVDGTGNMAVVVRRGRAWAPLDTVRIVEFPTLIVDFYADPSRTVDGLISQADAEDRAFAMYRAANPDLHGARDEWWGAWGSNPGLLVISCHRLTEPEVSDGPVGGGSRAGAILDSLGDSVRVSVGYGVETVH